MFTPSSDYNRMYLAQAIEPCQSYSTHSAGPARKKSIQWRPGIAFH